MIVPLTRPLSLSLLQFGILFWEGAGGELSTRIFRIHKQVIRSTVGVNSRTSCRQLFKELNILTIVSLYILEVTCYIRKHRQFVELNSNIHTYSLAEVALAAWCAAPLEMNEGTPLGVRVQ
jgi:hypothetical protein